MNQITPTEIENALAGFQNLTEAQTRKLFKTFQKKQEALLVYVAAIAEREGLNEEEYDVLMTLTLLCWELIRKKNPGLKKVKMKDVEELDDLLYESLEKDPVSLIINAVSSPQPHLVASIFEYVDGAGSEVRNEAKEIISLTLQNVIQSLLRAAGQS